MENGELWANIVSDLGYPFPWKQYPLKENTFGSKEDEDVEIEFRDGCLIMDDITCK